MNVCDGSTDNLEATKMMEDGVTGEEAVIKLLNYYFSVDNLKKDTFLQEHMNADGYINLDLLLEFPMMIKVHATEKDVLSAAKSSDAVEIDAARKVIRPKKRFLSTTLILRDVLDTVIETDISELFNTSGIPKPQSIRKEAGRNWYLSFESEDETKVVEEYLNGKKLKDKDVRCRIKAEPIVKPPVYVAPVIEIPVQSQFDVDDKHHGRRKNGSRSYRGRGRGFKSYANSKPIKQDTTNFPPLKTPATTYSESDITNILHSMDNLDLPTYDKSKWELQILMDTPVRELELEKPVPQNIESLAPARPRTDSTRSNDGHSKSKSPRKNKKPTAAEIAAKAAPLPVITKPKDKTPEPSPKPEQQQQETKTVEPQPVQQQQEQQPEVVQQPIQEEKKQTLEDDKLSFVEVIKKNKNSKKSK